MTWFTKRRKRRELPVKATFAGLPIRSEFVLNRMRNTKWEDCESVFALISLERYVLEGPRGMFDAWSSSLLRRRYPDAADAIEAELLTSDELVALQECRAEAERYSEKAMAAEEARKAKAEEKLRREWLALGGKP